jgi:hypothetical protein
VKPRARAFLAAAVAAVVLGAVAAAFVLGFEKETVWVDTGYGAAARANPYLALERLLQRMGVPAHTHLQGALAALPPPQTTLLVPVTRLSLESRVPELLAWMQAGGRLIVVPNASVPGAAGAEDALLAAFDVTTGAAQGVGFTAAPVAWPGRPALRGRVVQGIVLSEGARQPAWKVPAGRHSAMLAFAEGQGSLTILASAGFLTNGSLGDEDHALLAWLLASEAGAGRPVTIVARDDAPGLPAVLWRAWPEAMVGALCLLAAFLWRGAARFGPVSPAGDPPRRSLREHVEATGRFLWRTGRADALLAASRQSLAAEVARRHPAWSREAPRDLEERTAGVLAASDLLPRPAGTAGPAGAAPARRITEKRFVEAAASIEKVRRSL